MTKILVYSLNTFLLTTLLFSCGAPAAKDVVISDTVITETVNSEPTIDVSEDLLMAEDVMEATEKMQEPEVLDTRPAVKRKAATAPPKKPAPNATRTEAPAVEPVVSPTTAPVVDAPPAPETPATAPAAVPTAEPVDVPQRPVTPTHDAWNTLLKQYVNSAGNVNYAAFKKDEAKLDIYLAELSGNSPTSDWTRREGMAYWINAYNAATIKLILRNWPLKSIMDLHGGKPWDVKWIELGGKTYSLNNIEHDILRPRYKDPRIHFAVNCAATSCPPIPNKAFTPSNLTSLMDARARAFIRNPAYNTIGETVAVSNIFDWYGEDFGDLREYLNKYATTPIPEGKEIGFKAYDWALNKQ
ncbi:MAG: hypothetical protein ACI81P_003668 [Neolewinella sp.]|jgi:hypothetical protein